MISPDVSMRGNKTQKEKKNTHHQFKVNSKYDVVVVGEEGIMGEAQVCLPLPRLGGGGADRLVQSAGSPSGTIHQAATLQVPL